MKKQLHPNDYRPVVFADDGAKFSFLTKSTATTKDTIKWEDGQEYPLIKVHISSASHPFFTGEEKIIDTEGRVDRFKARQELAKGRTTALANKAKKAATRATKKAQIETESNTPAPKAKKAAVAKTEKSAKTTNII